MQFHTEFQFDPAQDRRAEQVRNGSSWRCVLDSYADSYNDGIGHKCYSFIHNPCLPEYTVQHVEYKCDGLRHLFATSSIKIHQCRIVSLHCFKIGIRKDSCRGEPAATRLANVRGGRLARVMACVVRV